VLAENAENLTLLEKPYDNNTDATGNSANNTLTGTSGNNRLDGAQGADTMVGGNGNDLYIVDNVGDVVSELANGGRDTVHSSVSFNLAANVENLTLTGSADAAATGNALANILIGNDGNNRIEGGAGNDLLMGQAGADVYRFSAGFGQDVVQDTTFVTENGVLQPDSSVDVIEFDSTISSADIAVELSADDPRDLWLNVTSTGDRITLRNYLADETGADYIEEIRFSDGTIWTPTDVFSHFSRVFGTDSADVLNAAAGGSIIYGRGGDDVLNGGDWDDVLNGGTYEDTMAGGAGNDVYTVDNLHDVIIELPGEGIDTVHAFRDWTLGANVENLTIDGYFGADGTGNDLDNVLIGNDTYNVLDGGAGADTMRGRGGNDTYVVDSGGDIVIELDAEGWDVVRSRISYVAPDNVETIELLGAENINATGNADRNELRGNSGDNILDGGAEVDDMAGGAGDDQYIVDSEADITTENANAGMDTVFASVSYALGANIENLILTGTAAEGSGNDLDNLLRGNASANILVGGTGNDVLEGGAGDDSLQGTSGNSLFNGGAGTDTLHGSLANDLLIGGTGNDLLDGGGGADIIAFNRGDGQDALAASAGQDDTLSLGGGIAYADLLFRKSGNDLILVTATDEQLTFVDWYASTNNHSVATLQMVIEGTSDYDGASGDTLRNEHLQEFDFDGLVAAFDAARAATPGLTSWALSNALASFHLSGSDTAAIGGDLAYRYGRDGTLGDVSFTVATGILGDTGFGSSAQELQGLASLQNSSPRLS
jgi:Ca2+-binding RTX toxin-like protein